MAPLLALALTLAVEVPLYTAGLWGLGLARPRRGAGLAVAANVLTHPLLWRWLATRPTVGRLAVAERIRLRR